MANENSTYSIAGRFSADKIVAGFLGIKDASDRTTQRVISNNQRTSNSWNQHAKSMGNFIGGMHKMDRFLSGYQQMNVGSIFRSQVESFKPFIDEALKLSQAQSKFRGIGLPEFENQKGFAAAVETVKSIKGLKIDETIETLSDLHTALGDLGHAIEALPIASKFRFGFSTVFGDKFSPEEIEKEIQSAFKYLENTGAVAKGREEMERRFNVMGQMMAGSAGRVRPSEMLLMSRRGGPALQGLSAQGLRNLSAPIQELGGSGTGTALAAVYRAVVAGRAEQSANEEFMRLGLLDSRKIKYGKAQKIKRLEGGANKLGAMMMEDPLKAADALMEAMKHPLKGKAIDTSDDNKVRQELSILFGKQTALRLMSILVTQRKQIVKEADISAAAETIQQLYDRAIDTPAGKIKQFENAVQNLEATVGGPLLNAVAGAATTLTPLMKLFGEYPLITLWTLAGLKASSMLIQLAAAARLSGLTTLFGSGVPGAGSAAGSAAGVAAGGSRLAGIATGTAYVAGFAAMAYLLTEAIEQVMSNNDAARATGDAGERTAQYFRERFKARLQGASDDVIKEIDNAAASGLAKDIVTQQGLATAGGSSTPLALGLLGDWDPKKPFQSPFATQLETSAAGRKVGKWASTEQTEAHKDAVGAIYNSGIMNAKQLSEYLRTAETTLRSAGHPELFSELSKLATEAFPQLMDEVLKAANPIDEFTQAIRRATSVLGVIPAPGWGWHPPNSGPSLPGSRPPGSGGVYIDHGPFKLSSYSTPPSYEPPVHLMPAMMKAASNGAGDITVNVSLSVPGGSMDQPTMDKVIAQTKRAVLESGHEIRKGLDERIRSREMTI